MSAINSLLNMAAFRSRTVDLVACQFESSVVRLEHVRLKLLVVIKFGDANGDVGALAGCVICIVSRWDMLLGGDIDKPPLLSVSTRTYNIYTNFGKKYMLSKKYNCWLLITKKLGRWKAFSVKVRLGLWSPLCHNVGTNGFKCLSEAQQRVNESSYHLTWESDSGRLCGEPCA